MSGVVYLVGAGPGDPGLITEKGLRYLREADVVIYDRLVSEDLLEEAPEGAELIDVGKWPGRHGLGQEGIASLLVEKALKGLRVVRLKGGDPFVLGRGGEEAEVLAARGIAFHVVPGVTSAVAVPAYAGVPVTHREYASAFSVSTGHRKVKGQPPGQTRVVLMGVKNLASVTQDLIEGGLDLSTPAALIHQGTTPAQRVLVSTLGEIRERAGEEGFEPPSVLVVGGVVGLRAHLSWYERLPLFGVRVVVTRERRWSRAMVQAIRDRGGHALVVPTIEVLEPPSYRGLDQALSDLSLFEWVIFTSSNGVERVMRRLARLELDARAFAGTRILAIGPETSRRLETHGLRADFTPSKFSSQGILAEFPEGSGRVLMPRSDRADDTLPAGLQGLGYEPVTVTAYVTRSRSDGAQRLGRVLSGNLADYIALTSPSTAEGLVESLHGGTGLPVKARVACIGPVTAEAAGRLGIRVDAVSLVHSAEGLVEAIIQDVKGRKGACIQ
ncbi:MAG: uroporphyrinogen-III C-methyltransferase [Bacillota bacterium]